MAHAFFLGNVIHYYGCYQDDSKNRALAVHQDYKDTLTLAICVDFCQSNNLAIVGLQVNTALLVKLVRSIPPTRDCAIASSLVFLQTAPSAIDKTNGTWVAFYTLSHVLLMKQLASSFVSY